MTATKEDNAAVQLKPSIGRLSNLIRLFQVCVIGVWVMSSWILYHHFGRKPEVGTSLVRSFRQRLSHTPNAVFFNVVIPAGDLHDHAIEIARSQMKDIKRSSLSRSEVFCNVFGDVPAGKVPFCDGRNKCRVEKRGEQGNETTTLFDLYNHCLQHQQSAVTYIHNEGSFANTLQSAALREMHMRALVRTDTCRNAVQSGICNVCSARFSPLPHFHTSGNMWTAHCSYVKNLISPIDFELRMKRVMQTLELERPLKKDMLPCTGKEDCIEPPHVGLTQYCSEHWIYSHPAVVPCDVLPTKYSFLWTDNNLPGQKEKWKPDVFVGPRFPLSIFLNNYIPSTPKWLTLEGRIFEWKNLYESLPPRNSWIWYYYGRHSWDNALVSRQSDQPG